MHRLLWGRVQARLHRRGELLHLGAHSLGLCNVLELAGADVSFAQLVWVRLEEANLSRAHLQYSDLDAAFMSDANLSGAYLKKAKLFNAQLKGADLSGAILKEADLTDADVSEKQLLTAKSLEGATMPNGQKYEDWLKEKEARK